MAMMRLRRWKFVLVFIFSLFWRKESRNNEVRISLKTCTNRRAHYLHFPILASDRVRASALSMGALREIARPGSSFVILLSPNIVSM